MAVWMVRAGRHGQQEQAALKGNFVTIHWIELPDLSKVQDKGSLTDRYREAIHDKKPGQVSEEVGEIWKFLNDIKVGHMVVLPLHKQPNVPPNVFAIGRVIGPYCYRTDMGNDIRHTRQVEWLRKDIPAAEFPKDLLRTLQCPPTVYGVKRNNAEERIQALVEGIKPPNGKTLEVTTTVVPPRLTDALNAVRDKIDKAKQKGKNVCEADTQTAMIDPVLQAIGWNLGNLDEVRQQYKGTDYALFIKRDSKPIMLVEAKALMETLDDSKHGKQIMGYAGTLGAAWVVLTNGDEYRIYNATCGGMDIKERLFRTVRLTAPNSSAGETLALLSRERLGDLQRVWDEERADGLVSTAIRQLFSPLPHSRLLSFVNKEVKSLTPTQIKESLKRICPKIKIP